MSNTDSPLVETVAIIGMAGRFPGAPDIDRFWDLLRDGVEGLTRFTEEELVAAGVPLEVARNPVYVPAKGILADVDNFDASFFGYTPREAALMDPQQRLMLECGWHALERAGYDPERYEGSIGVYAGAGVNTYMMSQLGDVVASDAAAAYQVFISNDKDFLATRLSYKAGLRGPSIAIQTACSTSLVAIHLAAQALLAHQCDIALAGGVSATFPHVRGYLHQEGMILSPDGHCRTFDAKGAGIVPGEGVAVITLKRLSEALADGDNVLAVIKGSAINNDGAEKAGYTAPSVAGQAEVIAMAQAVADVEPDSITYVEAHGTATPLGDPIECAALTKAFRTGTDRRGYCAIGSVKSNIGHLDTAAGVAGLVKTVLALQHRQIPPSLHFERSNPALELENSPFFVNTRLREWHSESGPRRAGVSSFGIGGTNAHVVLEEAPERIAGHPAARRAEVLVLSARSEQALVGTARQLASHLRAHPELPLADVAHTLQVGRKRFEYRRTLVCRSVEDAVAALDAEVPARFEERRRRGVVFMFPGQGAQRPGMARALYDHEPAFREALDECLLGLEEPLGTELRALLYAAEADEAAAARLAQTAITQPALFAVEYALARLWMSWGVEPEAMIGHSIGEYVAACVAGVFTLRDALSLVAARGRLMQSMPPGAMLAVPLPASELGDILGDGLELAASNAPSLCSVGGTPEAVDRAQRQLEARGITARRLQTSHAFHSSHMEPILEAFTEHVSRIRRSEPSIPFISGVTGTWIRSEQATDPRYWASQLRRPVRFADGVRELGPDRVFLEVGPGRALTTLVRQAGTDYHDAFVSLEQAGKADDDVRILGAVADLWRAGVDTDWTRFRSLERRCRVVLPAYPFARKRYWVDAAPAVEREAAALSGARLDASRWFYTPSWRRATAPRPTDESAVPRHWLVFEDEGGTGAAVADRLARSGAAITRVKMGAAFRSESTGLFTIDPTSVADVERLVEAALKVGPIDGIAHFSPLDALDMCDAELRKRVFYLPLYVARATLARTTSPCRFVMVSSGVQSVMGDERLDPAKAALLGACRVIPQEFPHCATVSVDVAPNMRNDAALVERLTDELLTADVTPIVALRGAHRWVQEFAPYHPVEEAASPLRDDGVYLITGGAGNIGVALAEHLASSTSRCRLAIVGRHLLEPEPSAPSADERSVRLARLRALEDAGAEVFLVAGDVSRVDDTRRAVAETLNRFGRIDGVFHLAGHIVGVPIDQLSPENAEGQFQPKLDGLRALSSALTGVPLEFAVVASSIASVLGGLGFAAYAGANASVDAFVISHRGSLEPRWTTVNWDAWEFDENAAQRTGVGAELRRMAIRPHEGAEAWMRILSDRRLGQVIVSTSDLKARQAKWTEARTQLVAPAVDRPTSAHARPALTSTFVEPRNDVEARLAAIWQELLGVDRVGVQDNFFELGGHSLLAVQIASRVREQYTIDLPLKRFFEAVTIAELSEEISAVLWANEGSTLQEAAAGDREEFRL